MARITVEDCLEQLDNRFQLVLVASKRARQLASGARDPLIAEENDKPSVLALREIASHQVTSAILDERDSTEEEQLSFHLAEPAQTRELNPGSEDEAEPLQALHSEQTTADEEGAEAGAASAQPADEDPDATRAQQQESSGSDESGADDVDIS